MTMLALDVVKSVSSSEDEILLGIMSLHNAGEPFDADVTFNVGGFYKNNVPEPKLKFDLKPLRSDVARADVSSLPLAAGSINSIVFDPPFMFNLHGSSSDRDAAVRYGSFDTWDDLVRTYKGGLSEFRRILKPKGIVAFKCQDFTDTKTTMTHCLVYQWSVEAGFYVKDCFVRYKNKGQPSHDPSKQQRHAYKSHSYWFVLEKPLKT